MTSTIDAVAAKSNPVRYVMVPAAWLAAQRSSGNASPATTPELSPGDSAAVDSAVLVSLLPSVSSVLSVVSVVPVVSVLSVVESSSLPHAANATPATSARARGVRRRIGDPGPP
jgi:hypothetical protein